MRFMFSKEEDEEEDDEQSVKIMFTCISYLVLYLHTIFCMQSLFDMFSILVRLN